MWVAAEDVNAARVVVVDQGAHGAPSPVSCTDRQGFIADLGPAWDQHPSDGARQKTTRLAQDLALKFK
jgi:hypothetical protein